VKGIGKDKDIKDVKEVKEVEEKPKIQE